MDFSALYNSYFTLSNIYAERQEGFDNARFERKDPRPTDAFLLFTDSTGIYSQNNRRQLYVPNGALVYIPRGSVYSIENHAVDGKQRVKTMLFEFTLHKAEIYKNDEMLSVKNVKHTPITFNTSDICIMDFRPKLYERLFASLIDTYNCNSLPPISVFQAAYAIFECLLVNMYGNSEYAANTGLINSSMTYLGREENPEKTVAQIADICCVSVSCLEKQYKKYLGMSPLEYRLECKMERAKAMLSESEMSVSEIAENLKFCDDAYLCRIFKKYVGMTPRQYRIKSKN